MKLNLCILLPLVLALTLPAQQTPPAPPNLVTVDASVPLLPPETGYLHLGGTSPDGHSLQVNSQYLVRDGKPWLPVMGEFHFSRYPAAQWEEEILKMKAGGVNIVSTYVFWIHHEEVQGHFDWSGQRDLRRFVELCAKHGMYVWLRVGPWAHGEARNGGFPDWLMQFPHLRTNDPAYLHAVEIFFNQIGEQTHSLMFKDGGPIIGTQLENEYGQHGSGRGAEHILKLKQLALAAGIDTPFWSVTGWPSLDFPPHEVMPVSGGYPDGFWFANKGNLPPSSNYLFNFNRALGDMGATAKTEDPTGKVDLHHDPYFAAEQAGGMASSYRRRPVLSADDIAALTLTGLGSGLNLYGYYMFHGGANPKGALTTLQESTATKYPNDLPEITYDFEAPLGEYGQVRDSYRKTRILHLFVNAFGSSLATMPAFGPAPPLRDAADAGTPRVAVRTDGRSGFVFVNNHVRQLAMPARPGFQVRIKLPGGDLFVPAQPIDVPADRYFAWPFQLALGNAMLRYSTAQLLTQLDIPTGKLVVFFAIPGITPEFAFDSASIRSVSSPSGVVSSAAGTTFVRNLEPRFTGPITVTDSAGAKTTILLLTQQQAENTTLLHIANADHLLYSVSTVFWDGHSLHLQQLGLPTQHVEMLPDLPLQNSPGHTSILWTEHSFTQPAKHGPEWISIKQIQPATPRSAMTMSTPTDPRKPAVPIVPPDTAFEQAEKWQILWNNPDLTGLSEAILLISYTGDIARLTSGTTLLDDNFYKGVPFEIGLRRFASDLKSPLTLSILPMPPNPPIYLEPNPPIYHVPNTLGELPNPPKTPKFNLPYITIIPVYESVATPTP